jgi:hypothetical protein
MSAQNGQIATPAWKTILIDSLGFVLVVWSIPVVILLVGAPIALVVALIRWMVP